MTDPVSIESAVKEYRARLRLHPPSCESRDLEPESRASSPAPLSSADAKRQLEPPSRASISPARPLKPTADLSKPLAERLELAFGAGDNPALRRALYLRVQFIIQTFGPPAEEVLREVVDYALAARRPGNCFAFTIIRRLRERGFTQEV